MDTTKMNTYFNKHIKTVWISIITTILLSACGGGNEAEENRCAGRALATGNECITLSDREVIVHKPSSQKCF